MRTSTKAAGFFAADVSDITRSADFARCDWEHETARGAKLFRKGGEENIKALSAAVYASFGINMKRVNEIKVLQRKAAKRNRKLTLNAKDTALMTEFNRVAKSVQRIRDRAFPQRKAARTATKQQVKGKVTAGAQALLNGLKALGYGVKIVKYPKAK